MNRKVIVAVFVVAASGVVNSWVNKKPITPVIMGAYIFLLMLAVMDTFGGQLSVLSGAFAMLAMTYVLLVEFPWQTIISTLQGKPATTGTPTPPVGTTPPGAPGPGGIGVQPSH